MKKTIIVLIVVAVIALFYWQFFVPTSAPVEEIEFSSEELSF